MTARTSPLGVALEEALGRPFGDRALLRLALTHSSAVEGRDSAANERLEFLGDRVLGLVAASRLYRDHPAVGEDGLAPRFNAVVNRQACARAARRAGIGPELVLSRAEEQAGGRLKETILADAAEAIVASLYLEGGLDAAAAFVERFWAEEFAAVQKAPLDPKTALQEWAAAGRKDAPVYEVVSREGPDHAPTFTVRVQVRGVSEAVGRAGSKREAERAAAADLLRAVGVDV